MCRAMVVVLIAMVSTACESGAAKLERLEDELYVAQLGADRWCEHAEDTEQAYRIFWGMPDTMRSRLRADTALWRRLGYRETSEQDVQSAQTWCHGALAKQDSARRALAVFMR